MASNSRHHGPERPRHDDFVQNVWALRGHSPNAVTRLPTHLPDGFLGQTCDTGLCHPEMYEGEYAGPSTLKEKSETGITTSVPSMTFYFEESEFGHEEDFEEDSADHDMVLESDQDALRVAYAHRHNLVLDSTAPQLAPHIVITPPEKNIQDYYIPWFNATGPQWPSHLMVTVPANAMDYSLACVPSVRVPPLDYSAPARNAKTVFCLSKFKAFVSSTMHERVHLEKIMNVLQKHHRKAVAFAASEIGQRFLACDQYVCPSEKPFRWTDPAEPFLQRTNQYRGTTVLESPSPFTVPHIIINEPPPQDPWIPWHNATNPQDHGFGLYLAVPNRLVYHANVPDDDADDFWSSASSLRSAQTEPPDFNFNYQEDLDSSGSSSSESEPDTPDPDSLMDDFVLEEDGHDCIGPDVEDGMDINFFDSCEESPWSGIINRYSAKTTTFVSVADSGMACDEDDDELPPFDDWYQSIAARTRLATMTA